MRKSHPLVELSRLPWWASVIVAAIAFVGLRWLVPMVLRHQRILAPLAATVADHAIWIAGAFLLPIPFSLAHAAKRRRIAATPAILERINALSWQDFELLVAEAYRRKGYKIVERGGATTDGGVDLELHAKGKTIIVQCKRWRVQVVGVDRVRELFGVMVAECAGAAILVSSGRYSPEAIDFAHDKPIELVDGNELSEMLASVPEFRETKQSLGDDAVRVEPGLVATSTGIANTEGAGDSVCCPKCGSTMIRRVAKQGSRTGQAFWGCSRFPACRGIAPAK
jgi:restriction system protein